jgi:hypothetical protein
MKIIEDPSDPDDNTDNTKSFELPAVVWLTIVAAVLAGVVILITWLDRS